MKKPEAIMRRMLDDNIGILTKKLKIKDIENECDDDIKILNNAFGKTSIDVFIDDSDGYIKSKYSKNNDKNENKNDEMKDEILSNFYIMPRYIINRLSHLNKEKLIYAEIFSFNEEEYCSLILNTKELENGEWLNQLNKSIYKLFCDYRTLKKILDISLNHFYIEEIDEYSSSGWYKQNKEWFYNCTKTCFECHNYLVINDYKIERKAFKAVLDSLKIAPSSITIPLLSYCILGLTNELLRSVNLEPKFILTLSGDRDTYVMQLAEYFSNNMDVEKGLPKYCTKNDMRRCYGDHSFRISIDESENSIVKRLNYIKDKTVIIDGILKAKKMNTKSKLEEMFLDYYSGNIKKPHKKFKEKSEYRALPIFITDEDIESLMIYKIAIEKNAINPDELLSLRKKDYLITESASFFIEWVEDFVNNYSKNFFNMILNNYEQYRSMIYYNYFDVREEEARIYSWLLLAYTLYLQYGLDKGFITSRKYKEYRNDAINEMLHSHKIDDSELDNVDKSINIKISKEETEVLNLLKVIEYIYEKESSKLIKDKGDLDDKYIGWLINVDDEKENGEYENREVICFIPDQFISIINEYGKAIHNSSYSISKKQYDMILRKKLKDGWILKVDKGASRYTYKRGLYANKKYESKEDKIAFRIDKMKEYIELNGIGESENQ